MQRLLAGGFFLCFGLVFLAAGLWIRSGIQPYDDGIVTTGTVVDHEDSYGSDSDTTAVIFEFRTEDGRTIRKTDSLATSDPTSIGETIEVSYRPSDPDGARNLSHAQWFPWLFIGIGSFVMLLGAAAAVPAAIGLAVLAFGASKAVGGNDNRKSVPTPQDASIPHGTSGQSEFGILLPLDDTGPQDKLR